MKRLWCLALCFLFLAHSYSLASGIEDAKAVLIKEMPDAFGAGSIIKGPVTLEEVEKVGLDKVSGKDCPQVPFGYQNKVWEKMKSQYRAGDIILYFKTDSKSWASLSGREGFVLIRGKEIIATITILMN
jgi:hypothetical protein